MALLFSDDFERSNSSTVGNDWSEIVAADAYSIVDGQLRVSYPFSSQSDSYERGHCLRPTGTSSPNNGIIRSYFLPSASSNYGLICRWNATTGQYGDFYLGGYTAGQLYILRITGSSVSVIATSSAFSFPTNALVKAEFLFNGSTLTLRWTNVNTATVLGTANGTNSALSSGRVGFSAWEDTSVTKSWGGFEVFDDTSFVGTDAGSTFFPLTNTITGGKYSGTISSVGSTTRLINSAASFSSGDFSVGRIVGLWNSAGTAYKGVAWIRRWISSTELELEKPFISDSGEVVTQVVGDSYIVSRNFVDSSISGVTVSGSSVTLTGPVVFGTPSVSNSVCFYDESKNITVANSVTASTVNGFFRIAGGLVVFGQIVDWATRKTSRSCNILTQNTIVGSNNEGRGCIHPTSTAAKLLYLGGSIFAQSTPSYLGANFPTTSTPAEFQEYWNVYTNIDFLSNTLGGNWTSLASKQKVIRADSYNAGSNGVNIRWGDGYLEGGNFTLKGSIALSVFGSDIAGTYNISAPAGTFLTIDDCGISTPVLWWSFSNTAQTVNYTNLITPNRKAGSGNPPTTAASNCTQNFRWSGVFTNLISGTLALIKNNNLRSDVETSATTSTTVTLTIQEATVVGFTETVRESSWAYGFYFYGYQIIAGTFATTTVTASGGQTSKAVIFGKDATQVIDVNITQTNVATVAAYTVLDNSDRVYDYSQYWKALSTSNAVYPTYDTQLISNTGGTLSTSQNVTIDTAAGSVFAVNTGTSTITIKPTTALSAGTKSTSLQLAASRTLRFNQNGDKSTFSYLIPATGTVLVASGTTNLRGSVFTSGATINVISGTATVIVDSATGITAGSGVTLQEPSATLSFTGLQSGSEIRVFNTGTGLEIDGTESSGTSFSVSYSGTPSIRYIVIKQGFYIIDEETTLPGTDLTVPITQRTDRVFSNP